MPGLTPLALHTWTLDTTPLGEVLRVARATGWDAVELRQVDFDRARAAGESPDALVERVRASGLAVSCLGGERGWMFARDDEWRNLLASWGETCRWAEALGARVVMSPADGGHGDPGQAADAVRAVSDLAGERGLRLAIEASSTAVFLRTLGRLREVLARADQPACGLLVDAYHLERSGDGLAALTDLAPTEIAYVQYSDVPPGALDPGQVLNRLPPGDGVVPFRDFFRLLAAKGYAGYLSYEAPNPASWARDPEVVAREAAERTRALLPVTTGEPRVSPAARTEGRG